MIQIQLKAKHFYLIANLLLRDPAAAAFSLLSRIKTATVGVQDEDLVIVECTTTEFLLSYRNLSFQMEGQYSAPNADMMSLLTPQIQAGVADNNAEWIDVAIKIQSMRDNNNQAILNYIANAKAALNQ